MRPRTRPARRGGRCTCRPADDLWATATVISRSRLATRGSTSPRRTSRSSSALARGPRRRAIATKVAPVEPVLVSEPGAAAAHRLRPEHLAPRARAGLAVDRRDERYGRAARWLLSLSRTPPQTTRPATTPGRGRRGRGDPLRLAARLVAGDRWRSWRRSRCTAPAARSTRPCGCSSSTTGYNFSLGLQAGALAGALAVGHDHPRLEDDAAATMRVPLHRPGVGGDLPPGRLPPAADRAPPETTLRSHGGAASPAISRRPGGYHTVDC